MRGASRPGGCRCADRIEPFRLCPTIGVASGDRSPHGGSEQRALVEQAAKGDEDAFASLAAASADRLMAIAFRILRDVGRAEDAVQQALLSAWRELPNLRDPERFEAWLRRLLVNACYAEARRERRWSSNIRVLTLDDAPATADASTSIALRDEFERLFRRLPPDQRAVFVYRHYLGYDLAEIATESRSRSAR